MFAVLHVGSFALRAALRLHAIDERAKHAGPAALFSANTRPSTVLACTEAARVSGVSVGMTAPQALARCPRLVVCPRSETGETEATALLRAVALNLSPTVEETEPGVCTALQRSTVNCRSGSLACSTPHATMRSVEIGAAARDELQLLRGLVPATLRGDAVLRMPHLDATETGLRQDLDDATRE